MDLPWGEVAIHQADHEVEAEWPWVDLEADLVHVVAVVACPCPGPDFLDLSSAWDHP